MAGERVVTVEFQSSFLKDLKKIKDAAVLSRVAAAIVTVEEANSLQEIAACKKLQGADNYYRIRIGDFRIGLSVENDSVKFVRFLSRGDIYKHFP